VYARGAMIFSRGGVEASGFKQATTRKGNEYYALA
jgi:hypothetical protein